MRAMILAAGRGERMRPLTDSSPKPLLAVAGKPLIVWHIERLARAGILDIVINHAWLGHMIENALGDGRAFGVNIQYSAEPVALETAGGIATALPLLGTEPFLVINADIWCDWDPAQTDTIAKTLQERACQAWLLMVPNPEHHPMGDFALATHGLVDTAGAICHTFSGIGVYQPAFFSHTPAHQPAKLAPLLREAMGHKQVLGDRYDGIWIDVGTPSRLKALDQLLQGKH